MGFRKQDRSLLAHWLKRQKQVMREKEDALEEGKTWFKRAKLAHDKGERELAQRAHERAADAKRKHDKALRELERIAMELETLRSSASESVASDSGAAARAEQITQNFERMGIDTDMAALETMAERADADQALSNLRNRFGGQGEQVEGASEASQSISSKNAETQESKDTSAESVDAQFAGSQESKDTSAETVDAQSAGSQDHESSEENKPTHRDSGLAAEDENTSKRPDDGFRLEPLGEDSED